MDQKILESMFEQSQKQTNDKKMQFTEEEAKRFKNAFADPKFREMFSEYMDEIQDPKHRQETEDYISQLETEQKVPEGKELIRPTAGFVAKTYKKVDDAGSKDKLFLNIVQSDKIAKPSKTSTNKGDCWSVPYSVGPPHMEKDKKGENATCFDCCFHPEALMIAERNGEFKKLIVNTAMEGVEEFFKRNRQKVQLDRDFHVVKGIQYKEGTIPTMLIATASKETWNDTSETKTKATSKATKPAITNKVPSGTKSREDPPASTSDDEKPPTTTTSTANTSATTEKVSETLPAEKLPTKSKSATVIKKGFLVNNNSSKKSSLYPEKVQTIRPKKDANEPLSNLTSTNPVSEPSSSTYELSENLTKSLNLASSDPTPKTEQPIVTENDMKAVSTVRKIVEKTEKPSEPVKDEKKPVEDETNDTTYPIAPTVVVKHREEISMGDFDGVKASNVASSRPKELVYEIQLPLVSAPSKINLDVSEKRLVLTYLEKYKLDMKLPYPIYDKKGKAAYDKTKKVLKVSLPVVQDTIEVKTSHVTTQVEEKKVEEISSTEVPETDEKDEKSPTKQQATTKVTESRHDRWVAKTSKEEAEDKEKEESRRFYEEIQKKAEQARLEALTKPIAPAASTKKEEVKVVDDDISTKEEFIASAKFTGRKVGYVFKKGDEGIGYYLDHHNSTSKATQSNKKQEEKKVAATPAKEAEKVKKVYEIPPVEIKQTKAAISILFQVPAIIKPSVKVSSSSPYQIRLTFAAFTDQPTQREYGLVFHLNEKESGDGIDSSSITFDVAGKNMVVVLMKKTEGIFGLHAAQEIIKSHDGDVTTLPSWIKYDEVVDEVEVVNKEEEQNLKPVVNETLKTSSSSSSSSSSKKASEAFKNTVNALQFSTDFISELD